MEEPLEAGEPFDAELYLRLLGEHSILDRPQAQRHPWESELAEVAAALTAVDALDADVAQKIVDDYELAQALRGDQQRAHMFRIKHSRVGQSRVGQSPPPEALKAPRVVVCEADLDVAQGTVHVHYVTFDDWSTALTVSLVERTNLTTAGPGGPRFANSFRQLTIADDQGAAAPAHFSGGGSMGRWFGRLATPSPLSRTTRWLDVGNARLALPADQTGPTVTVSVERLPEAPAAVRYLRYRLAAARHGGMPLPVTWIDASVDALVRAGALDRDGDVVKEVVAIASAMSGQGPPPSSVPAPWASALRRRGASDGPEGAVAIAAVMPPVDGVTAVLDGLISTPTGFSVDTVVSPEQPVLAGAVPPLTEPQLVWWAADDRDNAYLGAVSGWNGTGAAGASRGTLNFWPALDPQARSLRIMPTGPSERAVVTIDPLPWAVTP